MTWFRGLSNFRFRPPIHPCACTLLHLYLRAYYGLSNCIEKVIQFEHYLLQDIKDVVTFLMVGYIPKNVLSLLHSNQVNKLFRALIIYFQIYLKILEDLRYRKLAYFQNRLKHPTAAEREALCSKHMSSLRALIGQEYAALVTGTGFFKQFHHMNNCLNSSSNFKDVILYEYLFKFAARVVWISLFRSNFREIEVELSRLISYTSSLGEKRRKSLQMYMGKSDRSILIGRETKSKLDSLSPIIVEIFENEYKADCFSQKVVYCDTKLGGIEALLNIPEEMFEMFGLTLGILGQPKENYEPTLHVKQQVSKSFEEEALETEKTSFIEHEKPSVIMYQLLEELERIIDLQNVAENRGISCKKLGEMVRLFHENHFEDSKRSYIMWKSFKCS